MRILVLTDVVPHPEGHTSGEQLVYHRLRPLADMHEIVFAYVNRRKILAAKTSPQLPYQLVELPTSPSPTHSPTPYSSDLSRILHSWQHTLFDDRPKILDEHKQPELSTAISSFVREYKPEVIHVVGLLMLTRLPQVSQPVIGELVDMWSRGHWQKKDLLSKPTHKFQYWVDGLKIERIERQQLKRIQIAITTSEFEKAAIQRLAPKLTTQVMPPSVDTEYFQPIRGIQEPATLLYSGQMGSKTNVEAVMYFYREILPRIRQAVPNVRLVIAGRNPTPEIQGLADESVVITGKVPDIRPFFARASSAIVPLLHGTGVRNKIIEAWAMERAVVSTRLGAEGLCGNDGEHLWLADNPQDFAHHIISLLNNPVQRDTMGKRGRELVISQYSLTVAAKRMNEIYQQFAQSEQRGTNRN